MSALNAIGCIITVYMCIMWLIGYNPHNRFTVKWWLNVIWPFNWTGSAIAVTGVALTLM